MVLYKVSADGKMEEFKQEDFGLENYEEELEELIEKNPEKVLDREKILFIKKEKKGEKVQDLLGVDKDGNAVIIELKAGKTPRDVIAQAIEYAAEIKKLNFEDLDNIAAQYFKQINSKYNSLREAFNSVFLTQEDELPTFNQKQRIIIVGQEIDKDIEKVARYLRENYEMDIHCIKFSYYKTKLGEEILETNRIVGREEADRPKIARDFAEGKYKKFFDAIVSKLKEKLSDDLKSFETNPAKGKYLQIRYYKEYPDIHFRLYLDIETSFDFYLAVENEKLNTSLMSFMKEHENMIFNNIFNEIGNVTFRKWDIHSYIDWQEPSPENTEIIERITDCLKLYIETLKPILDEFLEKNKT